MAYVLNGWREVGAASKQASKQASRPPTQTKNNGFFVLRRWPDVYVLSIIVNIFIEYFVFFIAFFHCAWVADA